MTLCTELGNYLQIQGYAGWKIMATISVGGKGD
jgi:hypothetical protein